MTYVYKRLPEGGYTARPAESPVVVKRLLAQGWSERPPHEAVVAPQPDPVDAETVNEDYPDTTKKRGRKPRETVN